MYRTADSRLVTCLAMTQINAYTLSVQLQHTINQIDKFNKDFFSVAICTKISSLNSLSYLCHLNVNRTLTKRGTRTNLISRNAFIKQYQFGFRARSSGYSHSTNGTTYFTVTHETYRGPHSTSVNWQLSFHVACSQIIFFFVAQIINSLLIILSLINIGYSIVQSNNGVEKYQYPVYYVTPGIMVVTFVSVLDNTAHTFKSS